MKHQLFVQGNHAVAGVIEALLLVALVAVVLSTIQLLYIPEIMEQREADHMDEVANQFSFLKSVIDLHTVTKEDVPITAPLTLGSRELPYFVTAASYGEILVYDREYIDTYFILVDQGSGLFPLTSIYYKAHNRYYPENKPGQEYILEGGALILKQQDGENMLINPSMTIDNESDPIEIRYELPILVGFPGKNQTSGYKNCYIRTNYSYSDDYWKDDLENSQTVNISTKYPTAWFAFFNESLKDGIDVDYEVGSSYVKMEKIDGGPNISFYYKEAYIYVQISPGWID